MRIIIAIFILILILAVTTGCTPLQAPFHSSSSSSMVTISPADQKILEQHPDDLDAALQELDEVGWRIAFGSPEEDFKAYPKWKITLASKGNRPPPVTRTMRRRSHWCTKTNDDLFSAQKWSIRLHFLYPSEVVASLWTTTSLAHKWDAGKTCWRLWFRPSGDATST